MNYNDYQGKKRIAHLPQFQVDLNHKIQRLKTIWNQFEKTPTPHQTQNLTPMQHKAHERIKKQQLHHTPQTKTPQVKTTPVSEHNKLQKFRERRAKKIPETLPYHAPPVQFYYPNRSFESSQAYYTEDRTRLEACHKLQIQKENNQTKYKTQC